MKFLAKSLLLATVAKAAVHDRSSRGELRSTAQRISPELDHDSDKKFRKDYPYDQRPAADKYYVFNHPYPAVQDSGDYDADFVKDENSDGGRWAAQMNYDTLRVKIRAANAKLEKLKKKMEDEYEEWMHAKANEADTAKSAAEAGKDVEAAKKAAGAAERAVNDLEGSSQADGTKVGGQVGDAVKKVEKEMKDLEDCKKKLAEAKARLKKVLEEKEEFEKAREKAKALKAAKKAAREKALAEAKAKKKAEQVAAKKAAKAAKADEDDEDDVKKKQRDEDEREEEPSWDEAKWQKKLDREKKDHAEALSNYDKQLMDVKKTEDALARAAAELKKYRRPPYVDNGGGVYDVPESSAFSASIPAAIFLAAISILNM